MDKQVVHFSTRREFEEQLRACFSRARVELQLFDPDFALWGLGSSEVDALLRRFLLGKGRLQLVAHSNAHLESQCPRLVRLLQDFRHLIDCRLSSKNLRQLTDSFCIADQAHLVRRFHADHLRGEAVFDGPADTQVCSERFAGIWAESGPGLQANTTGL
jgi:hypothetical protein